MEPSEMGNIEQAIIPGWQKKVNNIFSWVTWGLLVFLIIPTILVTLAQNSIPGDSLYAIKLRMESGFLSVVKIFNKQAGFQIDYTQRRYQETIKVLSSKYSTQSIDSLFEQIVLTEEAIKNVKDPAERQQLTQKYVNALLEVNSGLENKKSELAVSNANITDKINSTQLEINTIIQKMKTN